MFFQSGANPEVKVCNGHITPALVWGNKASRGDAPDKCKTVKSGLGGINWATD
jgi:hypothetical protein